MVHDTQSAQQTQSKEHNHIYSDVMKTIQCTHPILHEFLFTDFLFFYNTFHCCGQSIKTDFNATLAYLKNIIIYQ